MIWMRDEKNKAVDHNQRDDVAQQLYYDADLKVCKCMAGDEGFEPSHAGIKIRCLNQLG